MTPSTPVFHENWYSAEQLLLLAGAFEPARPLSGAVLEIGCWEGRSTIVLAHACEPEPLLAVDTWQGNLDEDPNHFSGVLAQQRDVFAAFRENLRRAACEQVQPVRQDCHQFLATFREPVKFCHIDASHDYESVRRTLVALLPLLVPGGVLCGDDLLTAHAGRADLQGGVERAVREVLPGFSAAGNLWSWKKPLLPTASGA
ncbi:MAG: class I SAM-dependent methyltransferase [Planctomycetia bacterium]|nr:class I SAM-dependent methyltransferase [Planctomycetia bacterium]